MTEITYFYIAECLTYGVHYRKFCKVGFSKNPTKRVPQIRRLYDYGFFVLKRTWEFPTRREAFDFESLIKGFHWNKYMGHELFEEPWERVEALADGLYNYTQRNGPTVDTSLFPRQVS